MTRYTKQFASTMPASQQGQVSVLLQEGTADGSIKNFAQYKTSLEEYAKELKTVAKPLYSVVLARAYTMIDSWTENNMARMAQLDIETVFTEVDNIGKKIDVYHRLSRKLVKDIRDSVASLDTSISRQEILNAAVDYALVQYNTFNTLGVGRLYRDAEEAGTLFYDYRKGTDMDSFFDCVVDAEREGLVLPITNQRDAEITSVLVDSAYSTTSDLDVDPADNDLTNLLAADDGLYWVHSLLLLSTDAFGNSYTPPDDGVITRLVFYLSGYQDVNTLRLIPFTDNAMTISQISYEDIDGSIYAISTTDITIAEESVLTFNRVRANAIILDIVQKSYTELTDFSYTAQPADITEIEALMSSAGVQGIDIGDPGAPSPQYAEGYFYTIGFDYVSASLCDYAERGIYVTSPLTTTERVSEVQLSCLYEKSINQIGESQDSVEFEIFKYDYDSTDGQIGVSRLPIPGNAQDYADEELVINGDIGVLRFFPLYSSLFVYRDKTELTLGTDYTLSTDGVNFFTTLALLQSSAAAGPPYQLYVKLLFPVSSSVYTTSYSILPYSPNDPTDSLWLDKDRTAELDSGVVKFTYPPGYDVSYSKIFLVVLMRTLNYVNRETPIVLEYSLFAAEN